jgi:mono/diheme cytochrome c family protein
MGKSTTMRRAEFSACSALLLSLLPLAGCSDTAEAPPDAAEDGTGDQSADTEAPPDGSSSSGSETSGGAGTTTGEPTDPPSGPWDAGYSIPDAPQVEGDPEAGYRALLEEGYITCGIPFAMFDIAKPFFGARADGPTLPGRTGANAEVPYNWTVFEAQSGAELATVNCLECHAGYFDGELIVGLGRADYDSTESIGDILELVPTPEIPIPGLEEMARFANRMRILSPLQRTPTIGVNHAVTTAVALVAHRDAETLQWSDEALIDFPQYVVPTDTPPWWRVGKKNALFYNAMARGDHRGTMVLASSLCTDDVGELQRILSYFNDIRAYLASMEPPKYPFSIDSALAAQGREVYETTCAGCHGSYAADEGGEDSYPNLLLPLDVIGTDPLMAAEASMLPEFQQWFEDSPYGQFTSVVTDVPFPGYIAPPLDGIWATAPFFHNGSVPTLELVLDSARRPKYWRRVDYDSSNFDENTLGWPYTELDLDGTGGADGLPPEDAKHVYDTTRWGYDNGGHIFGDALSDEQRRAVLEYLKTL